MDSTTATPDTATPDTATPDISLEGTWWEINRLGDEDVPAEIVAKFAQAGIKSEADAPSFMLAKLRKLRETRPCELLGDGNGNFGIIEHLVNKWTVFDHAGKVGRTGFFSPGRVEIVKGC
jgi:hypothetical protein